MKETLKGVGKVEKSIDQLGGVSSIEIDVDQERSSF